MDVTSAQVNGFCIFGPSFLCFDLEPGAFTGVGSLSHILSHIIVAVKGGCPQYFVGTDDNLLRIIPASFR